MSIEDFRFSAFKDCTNLTSITLPKTLNLIPNETFYGCTKLQRIDLSSYTLLEAINEDAFDGCNELAQVLWPEKLQTIGNNAFKNVAV